MPLILLALLNPINDITTDFSQPPQFKDILRLEEVQSQDYTYPARFIEIQKKLHPDIRPLDLPLSPSKVYSQALQRVKEKNWKLIAASSKESRIEAVAQTSLMKFKDDVVIEIRPRSGGAQVHMRSRSRVGKSDLGANAERISRFLQNWPR